MSITDEELVRRLESVPMVPSPDFREAVLSRISKPSARIVPFKKRHLALGLAWAAAVALVVGLALFRTPEPRNAAATMAAPQNAITQSGDRYFVKNLVDWDQSKLEKIQTLPDGTAVLRARRGAAGVAELQVRGAGGEVIKTSIFVK